MNAQQLRNSILQQAIQGKLVPQDPNDEPASVLLQRIRKEKERLVKEGKLKKKDLECKPREEDEIPFEIPKGWVWCRLGEVFQTVSGTTPQSNNPEYYKDGTINWVRTTDLNNGVLENTEIKITEKALMDCNLKILPEDSVCVALYGGAGTIGKNAILRFRTTINQSVCALLPNNNCEMVYLLYYLQWQRPRWMDYASGSRKDPNINQIIVKDCLFPLPPLAEQRRIVAKVEELMPLVERYGKAQQALDQLNESLPARLRQSILQEAIQGRLVPQDPKEEPASELLKRIRKEKEQLVKEGKLKKKNLEETPIAEDEKPFEIPESWEFARFKDVTWLITDGTHSTPKYVENGVPFISVKNMSNGSLVFDNCKYISKAEHEELIKRCHPIKGDLLLSKVGTTGVPAIIDVDIEFSLFVSVALIKFSPDFIDPKYLVYQIKSPFVQEQVKEHTRGVGNKNWVINDIAETILVFPPLSEQKRIVAKVEELFGILKEVK